MSRRPVASNVRVKFWFENGQGKSFFGKGTANLFQAIEKYKSIALACKRIGMSYRYALHKISIAEERSGRRLVDRFRGGRTKGGAQLTQQGQLFLERYLDAERTLRELARSM